MIADHINGGLAASSPLGVVRAGFALNSFYRLPCGVEKSKEHAAGKAKVSVVLLFFASALT